MNRYAVNVTTVFSECQRGECDKCPGRRGFKTGHYGGSICQCSCHRDKSLEDSQERRNMMDEVFHRPASSDLRFGPG